MPLAPPVIKIVLLVSFIIYFLIVLFVGIDIFVCIHITVASRRRLVHERIVGIAAWSRRVNGFPVYFSKRSAGREPLNQVGIGDVWASERDQVRKPLGDQAIASFGGHTDAGDQLAAKEGSEVAEHAVAHQRL